MTVHHSYQIETLKLILIRHDIASDQLLSLYWTVPFYVAVSYKAHNDFIIKWHHVEYMHQRRHLFCVFSRISCVNVWHIMLKVHLHYESSNIFNLHICHRTNSY